MNLMLTFSALLGAFTWTFLEYVIHRWLGHDRRFRRNVFAREHIRHHIEGDYFAPTWKKLILSVGIAGVLGPLAALIAGTIGIAYLAGLLGIYAMYEVLHRREHTHPGLGAYGRWARRHHFFHHFENGKMNHGVTTPLWDLIFGTYRKPEVIHVPRRLCMAWLRDAETGAARAEHASRYVVG